MNASMIGGIVSGVVGAGAAIYGGARSAGIMKRIRKQLDEQRQTNQNWYDQRYNEDATQRADAQRMLAKTEEAFRSRNKQAQATAAVMGGTEESVAAEKAANAQAMADATGQITVNAEARKDAIEQQYQQNDQQLLAQIQAAETQRANNIQQAARGVQDAMASSGKSSLTDKL